MDKKVERIKFERDKSVVLVYEDGEELDLSTIPKGIQVLISVKLNVPFFIGNN